MALWTWRTLADERVEVDRHDGAGPSTEGPTEVASVAATAQRVSQWTGLAAKYAEKWDVPISWILAIIMAESRGNPKAENWCCAGLMAIYWSVHGKTKQDMLDPEKNVDYGTSLLARARSQGYDLPAAASMHVAGAKSDAQGNLTPHGGGCCSARCAPSCDQNTCVEHPDFPAGSPWGMCEHMFPRTDGDGSVGYIDRVVRFNNYWVQRLGQSQPAQPPGQVLPTKPASASTAATLVAFAIGAAAGYEAIKLVPWLARRIARHASADLRRRS